MAAAHDDEGVAQRLGGGVVEVELHIPACREVRVQVHVELGVEFGNVLGY